MKMTTKHRIAKYQFQDGLQALKTVIATNILFAVMLIMQDWTQLLSGSRMYICLLSALLIIIANSFYKWDSLKINIVIALIYVLLFLVEYLVIGAPNNLITMDSGVSKGILLELMIGIIPYVYMTLRIVLIIPILLLIGYSKTYHEYDKSLV